MPRSTPSPGAGSIIAGAEKLLVSQPAVSKHIQSLERALKVKLFDRTPKGVRLTEPGKILHDYSRRIFALATEAESALRDLHALNRGHLRIGATTTLAVHFLPTLLVRFRQQHPGIRLELRTEHTQALEPLLLDGRLDFALTESPPTNPALHARIFMHDQMIAIAEPHHPLARRRKLTLKDLSRVPFIARDTDPDTPSFVERSLTQRGLHLTPTLTLASTESIKHAVAAGLGISIISQLAAQPDVIAKRLTPLKVSGLPLARPLYLLTHRSRYPSRATEAFLQLLLDA